MQQLRRSRISSTESITLRLTNPASSRESEPQPFLHSRSPVLCHSYRPVFSFKTLERLVFWKRPSASTSRYSVIGRQCIPSNQSDYMGQPLHRNNTHLLCFQIV